MKIFTYKLTISIVLLVITLTNTHGQTLHAIIVADSKDATLGKATQQDIIHLKRFLVLVTDAGGYELKIHIVEPTNSLLFGSNYDVPKITSLILGLDMGEEDIFFFYYTGHGTPSFKEDDPFARPHIVSFEHKYLSLQTVQKLAQINEPRLSIVMGNLCNGYSDENEKIAQSRNIEWRDDMNLVGISLNRVRELLSVKGTLTATSSKRGSLSYSLPDGGIFTKLFINSFYEQAKEQSSCSWSDILNKTVELSQEAIEVEPYYELVITD